MVRTRRFTPTLLHSSHHCYCPFSQHIPSTSPLLVDRNTVINSVTEPHAICSSSTTRPNTEYNGALTVPGRLPDVTTGTRPRA